ncbi:RNase P/MRP, p29 subunit [Amniculicola lignicola CBS 123094]|uniref:Ribonuclease P protein subunit n=1 Tax=Amniculicola lignicola CBS 123094 TaxID=1392246 RepID=A0A6A5VXD4_9PLEO|nr:RNase P/MRP, p29 subunit [Amniculicola lignicola CBS 123094]
MAALPAASAPEPLAKTIFRRALPPDDANAFFNDRVLKRPLWVRPTSPTPSSRAVRRKARKALQDRAKKRATSLKPRPLSAVDKRKLGLLEIPKEQQKYEIYVPLHTLWTGYMRDILGVGAGGAGNAQVEKRAPYITAASSGPVLASADMHGALLEVVRARCVSRVGLKGIVVRDSKYVFELITEKNVVKTVPKEHSVFRFYIPVESMDKPLVFEIVGEQFQTRAPERANKKVKMHYQPDL